MTTVVSVEHILKSYQLGGINTGTIKGDFASWWARVTGNPDPEQVIGEENIQEGKTLWALRDVSFEVRQGEVLGIIGRNGAGKNHTSEDPVAGDRPYEWADQDQGRMSSLLEVGTGFHPDVSGRMGW